MRAPVRSRRASLAPHAGAVINLGVNAMKVYTAIDPSGSLRAAIQRVKAPSESHMAVWTIDGKEVRKISGADIDRINHEKYGETSQRMTWFDFQTTLRDQLPDEIIHTRCALHGFEQTDDGVSVHFCEGGDVTDVRCQLLLGVDGVYSQVRRHMTGESEQLELTRRVIFRGTSTVAEWDGPVDAFMGADEFMVHTLGGPFGSCMHSVFNDLLTFAAVLPLEVVERAGVDVLYDDRELRAHLATQDGEHDTQTGGARAVKGILLRLLGPFHDQAKGLVQGMKAENIRVYNDLMCLDPARAKWSDGRVALLGDAMHSMGVTGVGIGLAVEDAWEVASAVKEHGICEAALSAYVESRRPRVKTVYDKMIEMRDQAAAPTPQSAPEFMAKGPAGGGPAQNPPPQGAVPQGAKGGGAAPGQGPPGGQMPPGAHFQMFETWANAYLAEATWEPLVASAPREKVASAAN